MANAEDPTDPAVMDRWLPYLSPNDCEAGLRLAAVMVEAGMMGEAEAAEWTARLRAWKAAHMTEPEEA